MHEEVKEVQTARITEVACKQEADFRHNHIGREHRFGVSRSEFISALVPDFTAIVERDEETAVDDEGQVSIRLFRWSAYSVFSISRLRPAVSTGSGDAMLNSFA